MPAPEPDRTAPHVPADPSHDPAKTTDRPGPDTSRDPDRTGAHESTPAAPPPVFPALPGFEIDAQLGRGGMGVVYRARNLALGRPVAVKMILGGRYTDPMAQARFLVEAEVIARVSHPRVVQVFEFGRCDGQPYFVLEYVGGGSLADRLKRGRPAPRGAAALVAELADGVAAAHQKGVVHRDLKPANVLLTDAGEPKVTDFGLAKTGESDITATGAVMGTPSYMAPEQAAGRTAEGGTPADVYALGAILYECLTGRPPFKADTGVATIQLVLTRDPDRPRTFDPTIPRDLETVCLKCLAKEPARRYATAAELAADLRAYLAGRPIAARPVGAAERAWKWVRRNPGRAAALTAAVLVLVGAAVAGFEVRRQREADRVAAAEQLREQEVAAERQRADDRIAAEEKRQAEVRATRAAARVKALATAETTRLPELIPELDELRDVAEPQVLDLAARPPTPRADRHAQLLLARWGHTAELQKLTGGFPAYFESAPPDELVVVIDLMTADAGQRARHVEAMWAWAGIDGETLARRLRAAAVCARGAAADPRWLKLAPAVAGWLARENPALADGWAWAFEPVRGHLVPHLMRRYPDLLTRVRGGTLPPDELLTATAELQTTVHLLAKYTHDRPPDLAELAVVADAAHVTLFGDAVRANRAAVVPLLTAELARRPVPGWVPDLMNAEPLLVAEARRRGYAAAALVALGDGEAAWPAFRYPADLDPTARSYLVQRLAAVGADPRVLAARFNADPDVSAKQALLLALGEYPWDRLPFDTFNPFAARLVALYRDHPDPGLHSAIDWLLRQRWGFAKAVEAADAELAKAARAAKGAKPVGPNRGWYVNGQGQTFAIIRGPVEFRMGSPVTEPGRPREPGREDSELPHHKRIGRRFAVGTREVTVAEFLRFRPKHTWPKEYSPDPDGPAVGVNYYDACAYCNWLNRQEGVPGPEWRYGSNGDEEYAEGMQIWAGRLARTGYRLPTEAEWEYAARAGAMTARYFGRGDELLGRYAWSLRNSGERAWPCGRLRPNDLGLFDALGNAYEWVEDAALIYLPQLAEDEEVKKFLVVGRATPRVLRGGAFDNQPRFHRGAFRMYQPPSMRAFAGGFRVARTLPD